MYICTNIVIYVYMYSQNNMYKYIILYKHNNISIHVQTKWYMYICTNIIVKLYIYKGKIYMYKHNNKCTNIELNCIYWESFLILLL